MVISKRVGSKGFTIVELLIVVVIIAILAAITLVTYNGIQQRANNAAIIDAASKSLRMIQAYIAANDKYPYTENGTYVCITTAVVCKRNSPAINGNATFEANIATVGTLPRTVPLVSSIRSGITYEYDSARTVDGILQPAILEYYVFGVNSDCGRVALNSNGTIITTSTNHYTTGDVGGSGATFCVITIPGPSA